MMIVCMRNGYLNIDGCAFGAGVDSETGIERLAALYHAVEAKYRLAFQFFIYIKALTIVHDGYCKLVAFGLGGVRPRPA